MKKTYRNMALAAACVLTATGLWGCSTSVQIPDTVKVQQGDSSDNRITVSGMEEVKAVPDMAQIQYSVYTQAATAQECQEENAKNVNQTLETLKGLGVEEKSIQTSDYGLSPIYDYRLSDEYQHHSFRYPGRKRRKDHYSFCSFRCQ